jgi:predicted MPP superfamily phosphohydrolase
VTVRVGNVTDISSPAPRGRHFSARRRLVEAALRLAYPGDWPARMWGLVPGATRVEVVRHSLPLLPKRDHDRPPLRLAFASDLHLGPTTPRRTLDRAFDALAAIEPDVLLLGGDYVFLEATPARVDELARRVAEVPAKLKLAVLGNHDLWTHHHRIERALARASAQVLINDAVRLPQPWSDVAILGLDEPWTGAPDATAAIEACGDARLRLAIAHAPEAMPMLRARGVSLLMCGHTHGGQLALPGGTPIVMWGTQGRRYPHGLHTIDDLHLFVSRGIGGVEIPFRAWAPPDVAAITIR